MKLLIIFVHSFSFSRFETIHISSGVLLFLSLCFRQYEDDFEPDDEDLIQQELKRVQQSNNAQFLDSNNKEDDIYDFSSNNLGY